MWSGQREGSRPFSTVRTLPRSNRGVCRLPKRRSVQILHPFVGSIQQYSKEISDLDRYRPDQCPQCEAHRPLIAHGFYSRTLVDVAFDGSIRLRRYLCRCCQRTVSLLRHFALPYLRFVFDRPAAGGPHPGRRRPGSDATGYAIPARPVLRLTRSKFFMRIVIHPKHPTSSLQAHLALESHRPFQARLALERNPSFRLIPHWTVLAVAPFPKTQ